MSAKDFRTWHATVLMSAVLARSEVPATKRARDKTIRAGYVEVSEALGNTPAVCKTSYVDRGGRPFFPGGTTIALRRGSARRFDALRLRGGHRPAPDRGGLDAAATEATVQSRQAREIGYSWSQRRLRGAQPVVNAFSRRYRGTSQSRAQARVTTESWCRRAVLHYSIAVTRFRAGLPAAGAPTRRVPRSLGGLARLVSASWGQHQGSGARRARPHVAGPVGGGQSSSTLRTSCGRAAPSSPRRGRQPRSVGGAASSSSRSEQRRVPLSGHVAISARRASRRAPAASPSGPGERAETVGGPRRALLQPRDHSPRVRTAPSTGRQPAQLAQPVGGGPV